MFVLAVIIIILSPILLTLFGGKSFQSVKKKWKVFEDSSKAAFKIMFSINSEERLQAFQKIHNLFPKFFHFDFLNVRVL